MTVATQLEFVAYEPETSTETPPLLFVHGGSHAAWCWREHFLPYFAAAGFPSYALSFRGHGESSGYEQVASYVLDDYVEDVLQILTKIQQAPVLIGHSLGGAVVQKVWQQHPDKLKAVVLMASSPPDGMTLEWLKVLFKRFKAIYQMNLFNLGKIEHFPARARDLFFSSDLPVEQKEQYTNLLQRESIKAGQAMIQKTIDPRSMDTTIPLLVLGSRKDQFLSERVAQKVARTYKVTPVIFDTLCHDMMLDTQWPIVAEAILKFLQTSVA
ncbi:alpha/beta hydrolase [Dictyobacter arantiisoli]|uniref:Alpha/beta hydrolase n=1 Tax=Dictyobacter arantiisoli TaxID=2014874 RepID=A0A5A5T8B3_9CHLR|nr:alpha/beta hydrolase [Dictyobacter arantiisoli]GCF07144.1 alpha/beta hydrolase [Dictyobacter arantiisoli]